MILSHPQAYLAEIQLPVLAGSVGAALTLVIKKCGFRFQWCKTPLAHHTHTNPVPRLGGIAVFIAVAVACMFSGIAPGAHTWAPALFICVAAIPVLLIGAYDDLRHASPKAKVLAQLTGAVLLITANWYLQGRLSVYELLVLPAWLVISTNSFNLIDGLDGLATGTAIIIGSGLAIINFFSGNFVLAVFSIVMVAACLGFLPFNLVSPRIFLGDSGSLTIGFILAAIAFETPRETRLPWTALVLFGYPLTETTLTIVRRMLKGRSVFRPDREHMHHRMRHAGFSTAQAAFVLCLLALTFASLAVMIGLGASHWLAMGGATVLFLSVAKSFGYLRSRTLKRLRRRLAVSHQPKQEELPDIAGYLPFK